jgi:rare lipoprotein A
MEIQKKNKRGGRFVFTHNGARPTPSSADRPLFSSQTNVLYCIKSDVQQNLSKNLANQKLALSESEIACDGESRFFCVKEGDESCEHFQHEAESRNRISISQAGSQKWHGLLNAVRLTAHLRSLRTVRFGLFLLTITSLSGICFSSTGNAETTINSASRSNGLASFYGTECCRYNPSKGCPTASGRGLRELVKQGVPYAASWDFPFGTKVKVTNLDNGKSVTVIILDRGPNKRFKPRRIIDLNKKSFQQISNSRLGVCRVKVEVAK